MSSCSYVFNSQSIHVLLNFFFSSRRRHTRWPRDWSSDVCSSDLNLTVITEARVQRLLLDGKTVLGAEYLHQGKLRSEERRVGKECKARMSRKQWRKKQKQKEEQVW